MTLLTTISRRITVLALSLGLAAVAPVAPAAADDAGTVPTAAPRAAIADTIPLTAQPEELTAGPDGNVWVALSGSTDDLARVRPGGAVTYYDLPGVAGGLGALTVGPDKNLWGTLSTGVVKIPPGDPTNPTTYAINGFTDARGIDLGPDGNLWAASGDKVFRIPPANPVTATDFTVPNMGARGVAAGPRRIWVADGADGRLLAFRTDGTFTSHDVGGNPQGVAAGPKGQVLYTNPGTTPHTAGRLTVGGTPKLTNLPDTDPSFSVAFGADGAYWVGLFLTRQLARITPEGKVSRLGRFPQPLKPRFVAGGPKGTIWVSLQDPGNNGAIGKITGVRRDTKVDIKVVGDRAVVRRGKARLRLACPKSEVSGPCRGRASLRSLAGKRPVLGAQGYRVRAGRTATVRIGLAGSTVRRIGRAGLRVTAVVKVRDGAGNKKTVRKRILLVRAR
jgi:streptogramin lyase